MSLQEDNPMDEQKEQTDHIAYLQYTLQRKNTQLRNTQNTLSHARKKVKKMKEIIEFQRNRILELYAQKRS